MAILVFLAAANALCASAAVATTGKYPFNHFVVFGDQFSDDGSGSYAHGLDNNDIYGHHTWTDGPVWSTYLESLLGLPSVSYAWGDSDLGAHYGATVSNHYTASSSDYKGQPVPSSQQQILTYTSEGASSTIREALQIIWIGANDVVAHTNWWQKDTTLVSPTDNWNIRFYHNYTSLLLPQVETLIEKGAPAVMVVNLPPLHTTPGAKYYYCKTRTACYSKWGQVIEAGNAHLEAALRASPYASKILYYDVYSFWMHMLDNRDSYGFTQPNDFFCDGDHSLPDNKWSSCIKNLPSWSAARPYFYFTYQQPETNAYRYIAQNMYAAINSFFS